MSDIEKVPTLLQKQYTELYGPFVPGDWPIGSEIPNEGEVIWSYRSERRGLIYVVGGWRAFPAEVAASEVQAK